MAFMPTQAMKSRKKVARKRRITDFRKDFMQASSIALKTADHSVDSPVLLIANVAISILDH